MMLIKSAVTHLMAVWILFLHFSSCAEGNQRIQQQSATRLVVYKSARKLYVYFQGRKPKIYLVALGGHPIGPKQQEGDKKTPEGEYTINGKNPRSLYHLALHLSYPNKKDLAAAKSKHVSPGTDVEIHGLPPRYSYLEASHREVNWTNGCIALTDPEIEELWSVVPVGTPVTILP